VGTRTKMAPYYLVVAGVLLQGLSPVLTKLLLVDLSQATVVAARYCLAAALLMPFGLEGTRRARIAARPRRRDWLALVMVGALGSGAGALMFTAAVDFSSAGVVNAISKTAPIFVAFFAYFTLRERVTYVRLLLVSGMVGANVLIGAGEFAAGGAEIRLRLIGDALALGAGLTRAASEILAKSALRRFTAATVALWRFGIGFVVAAAVALGTGGYRALYALDLQAWALLVALAGGCTALSMFLYYRGMARIPAHVAVSLKLLGAVVTVVVSWVVLAEALNLYHVAGIGVLISGAYLLVLRTAREAPRATAPVQEPFAAARPSPLVALASSFRWKIVALVSVVIIATVASSTYLSVRHTQEVVREQVRLTMVQIATMILHSGMVEDRPAPYVYQQYLERTVAYRIESKTPLYAIDIVYIGLTDEGGNLVAFAYNPRIELVDEQGRLFPFRNAAAGRQLYELNSNPDKAKRYGIIPVEAEARSAGQTQARVWMGCRRSIADRPAAEIAARNAGLALLLLVCGIAAASLVVSRLTRPLERLSAAVYRLARGETAPVLVRPGSDEISQMARDLVDVQEGLALTRHWRSGLLRALSGPDIRVSGEPEGCLPFLTIELSQDLPAEGRQQLLGRCLEAIFGHDGAVLGSADGVAVMVWGLAGAEADDPLRALLAGIEVRQVLEDASGEEASGWATISLCDTTETSVQEMVAEHRGARATYGVSSGHSYGRR